MGQHVIDDVALEAAQSRAIAAEQQTAELARQLERLSGEPI